MFELYDDMGFIKSLMIVGPFGGMALVKIGRCQRQCILRSEITIQHMGYGGILHGFIARLAVRSMSSSKFYVQF